MHVKNVNMENITKRLFS